MPFGPRNNELGLCCEEAQRQPGRVRQRRRKEDSGRAPVASGRAAKAKGHDTDAML